MAQPCSSGKIKNSYPERTSGDEGRYSSRESRGCRGYRSGDTRVTMGVVENVDDSFQEHYPDRYRRCRSGGGDRHRSGIRGQTEPLSAGSVPGSVRRMPAPGYRRLLQDRDARLRRLCQGVCQSLFQNNLCEAMRRLLSAGGSDGCSCRIRLWGLSDGRLPAHGVAVAKKELDGRD